MVVGFGWLRVGGSGGDVISHHPRLLRRWRCGSSRYGLIGGFKIIIVAHGVTPSPALLQSTMWHQEALTSRCKDILCILFFNYSYFLIIIIVFSLVFGHSVIDWMVVQHFGCSGSFYRGWVVRAFCYCCCDVSVNRLRCFFVGGYLRFIWGFYSELVFGDIFFVLFGIL